MRQQTPGHRRRFPLVAQVKLGGVFAVVLLLAPVLPLHAQGCAQCLDSARATPPQVQAAYRHAILLLGGAGVALFTAGTLLLRRRR